MVGLVPIFSVVTELSGKKHTHNYILIYNTIVISDYMFILTTEAVISQQDLAAVACFPPCLSEQSPH